MSEPEALKTLGVNNGRLGDNSNNKFCGHFYERRPPPQYLSIYRLRCQPQVDTRVLCSALMSWAAAAEEMPINVPTCALSLKGRPYSVAHLPQIRRTNDECRCSFFTGKKVGGNGRSRTQGVTKMWAKGNPARVQLWLTHTRALKRSNNNSLKPERGAIMPHVLWVTLRCLWVIGALIAKKAAFGGIALHTSNVHLCQEQRVERVT